MKTPAISILMPVYNAKEFLDKSIRSILKQSFQDYELLVVNDGSTDDTISLFNQYSDERIRIINNHHNFIDSLNLGLQEARGKYIARMDADDYMLPERLKKQYEFMEKNKEISICGTWVQTFGNNSQKLKTSTDHTTIILWLLMYNTMVHPSVMLRKSIFEENKNEIFYHPDYLYAEDYHLWTQLALRGYKFANIPEILLYYRQSDKQVTTIHWTQMDEVSKRVRKEYGDGIIQKIIQEEEKYTLFFQELQELFNNNKINLETRQNTIRMIFENFLLNKFQ